MRKEKSRSPPKLSNGRFLLILACLPTTCKNTDSQGCVSIDFTLYYTILTLEDQRQALLLLTAYFSFKGQSENGCPFPFRNLRKELKELEKD
ncbi:hypothetical protein [[Ruminococcus] lactaris]|uniref:hypothetical protein n=1 Tax=[Ruminococcus] lactaris TaxID=46228 RepID=UPI00189E105A|nr:hypothetical protein [[Ruminococcus] lactaris]